MNKILLFVIVVCFVNVLLFFIISNSSAYMFNFKDFIKKPWTFFTFQFFHPETIDLIGNVVGLVFVGLIAIELGVNFKNFLVAYFLSIFLVVIPMLTAFPDVTVAGNSMGIYGVLALSLLTGRKLISERITMPLILFFIFSVTIANFIYSGIWYEKFFRTDFFHFFGFIFGGSIYILSSKTKHNLRSKELS